MPQLFIFRLSSYEYILRLAIIAIVKNSNEESLELWRYSFESVPPLGQLNAYNKHPLPSPLIVSLFFCSSRQHRRLYITWTSCNATPVHVYPNLPVAITSRRYRYLVRIDQRTRGDNKNIRRYRRRQEKEREKEAEDLLPRSSLLLFSRTFVIIRDFYLARFNQNQCSAINSLSIDRSVAR